MCGDGPARYIEVVAPRLVAMRERAGVARRRPLLRGADDELAEIC